MIFQKGQIYKPKEHIYETLDCGPKSRLELCDWSEKSHYWRCIIDENYFGGITEDKLVNDWELENVL